MKIRTNQIKRKYGEFIFKDVTYNEKEEQKEKIRKMEIYRWKNGKLSIIIDSFPTFVVKEKELVNGIEKLPKIWKALIRRQKMNKELQLFLIFPILAFVGATLIAGISVDVYWITWVSIFIAVNVIGLFIFILGILFSFTNKENTEEWKMNEHRITCEVCGTETTKGIIVKDKALRDRYFCSDKCI